MSSLIRLIWGLAARLPRWCNRDMTSQDNQQDTGRKSQTGEKPIKGRGKNPARRIAANMLAAILRGKTLDEARDRLADLSPSDRNLADAMVQTALRHFGTLEQLLKSYVKKLPPRASPARALLFIGAAQLLHMNVPAHAAIDETVAATGRREQPYRGLINAVLRNIARAQEAETLPRFEVSENLPAWLRENWLAAYGAENLAAITEALTRPPPLDLCFKTEAAANAWREGYNNKQDEQNAIKVGPTHIRLQDSGDVTKLTGFAEGDFWVQNRAAGQPALLLNDKLLNDKLLNENLPRQSEVLDICAAPGGKSLQLAAAGHHVTALDISKSRLARLKENLRRTGLTAEIICAEAVDWLAKGETLYDGILLDAPCTATGTLRRHPDLLRHRTSGDMQKLVALQKEILAAAAARVKKNGYLVYAVCAIQPQEGAAQIEAFLKIHSDFTCRDSMLVLPRLDEGPAHESDGFYTALMQKTAKTSE